MFPQEISEESRSVSSLEGYMDNVRMPPYGSTSQRVLLDKGKHINKIPRIMASFRNNVRFLKFGSTPRIHPPQSRHKDRDSITFSGIPPAKQSAPTYFKAPFIHKVNWTSVWDLAKKWIHDPMNMALLVWITCVAISGAILFLVMTRMLDGVLPRKSQRDAWFEVNNQILNALFTLMCLYQHPKRFHHLVLLCRWKSEDQLNLQKIYCKHGNCKPNERMHMMVVVVFLHINCFAQYALCGLNLGYPRAKRPAIGVGLCISVAIVSPAIASVYNIISPLGRGHETELDLEAQKQVASTDDKLNRRGGISREDSRVAESRPVWIGGLFDLWDDISLAYLSLFCSCCVFGWNMDRLGFGNMYVHITTFLLFCLAPFFIFNLAAINIDNEAIREALGISGALLCVFGLLYGGFWRIRMRKQFNLPENGFCCNRPALTDCFQWLFCCVCSLSQEVRTAYFYDIVDQKFYSKGSRNSSQLNLAPLPREIKLDPGSYGGNTNSCSLAEYLGPSVGADFKGMTSPVIPVIQRDEKLPD